MVRAKTAADRLLGLCRGLVNTCPLRRADGPAGSALLIGNCFPQVLSGDFYFDGARHTGTSEIERVMRAVPKVTAMRQTKERRKTYLSARAVEMAGSGKYRDFALMRGTSKRADGWTVAPGETTHAVQCASRDAKS